jgi:hypothetical protein
VQLHSGKISEAIALAGKLLASRPDDVEVQDLYLNSVVAGASAQVPGIEKHAKSAAKLLVDAKTIDQFYMAFVGHSIKQGRNAEALELIMEYADRVSGRLNGMLTVGDQVHVRRSRWIQSQTALIISHKN